MPTLSAGETDRGNHSVAIQRLNRKAEVQRTIRCQLATRLLWFIRRTEAIVAEDRLTLSGGGVGICAGVLQAEESRRCTRFLASPRLSTPERPWPMPNGFGSAGSRQNNLSESGATIFHSTQ